jgi:hypothetical protein
LSRLARRRVPRGGSGRDPGAHGAAKVFRPASERTAIRFDSSVELTKPRNYQVIQLMSYDPELNDQGELVHEFGLNTSKNHIGL